MIRRIAFYLFCLLLADYVICSSEPNIHDPVIVSQKHNKRGVPVFRGTILENETTVRLDQPLKATDADEVGGARIICGFRVLSAKHNCPFVAQMISRSNGTAEIKLKEGQKLNYEKRIHYKFSVVAYDCGTIARESDRAIVFVKVIDVDDFSPKFEKTNLFATLREGKIYDSLVQVRAIDQDQSQKFGKICSYEVITPRVPFTVDNQGHVKNTKALFFKDMHSYIIQVVARDCGGKQSKPISINIKVKEVCKTGWKDFPETMEYKPQSGAQKIAPLARLDWCDDCVPEKVNLKMHLATKHIGKGCDRDTYSIASQRKLCGASGESVDLLPSPGLTTKWTKDLPTDDGKESDQIFYFDGKTNAVEVPRASFNHSLHKHFTISTWMKHSFGSGQKKSEKEHVLCMGDGDGMDRHHYAMFVHGEKLIFLLRRESEDESDMEVFKPAEWRWHIPQINDNEWHHYAISVDFPEVHLYIDGMLLIPDTTNEEILDDWPIHKSKKVHFTKLVVGACWEGKERKFNKYFHGYLAGLSILKDKTESERVIRCLNDCKENLDFHALSEMESGTSVSFNSEMTEFSISSHNITEVERLLHEVSYINSRRFPTPGRRNINMRTSVTCKGEEIILPLTESYVMVEQSQQPTITVQGKQLIEATVEDLKAGRRVFMDVDIHVDMNIKGDFVDEILDNENNVEDNVDNLSYKSKPHKLQLKLEKNLKLQNTVPDDALLLDKCTIKAEPALDLRQEHMTVPVEVMSQFNMKLESSETNNGLEIKNADSIDNYRLVLQGVTYFHNNATMLHSRKFILSCSSQNGRFISNELPIKIYAIPTQIHKEPVHNLPAHAQESRGHVQSKPLSMPVNTMGVAANSSPNVGMVAIIVVCVGFLMFMIILGIIRIRATHKKAQVVQVDEKMEMEWDNSELNITVNPLEKEVFDYDDAAKKPLQDDSDSDDDLSSFHHSDSSEDETEMKQKLGDLEWDDSTMSI